MSLKDLNLIAFTPIYEEEEKGERKEKTPTSLCTKF